MTQGYYNRNLTVEDVRDHFDQIRDETDYRVPAGLPDELRVVLETIKRG
jgi:hypothetical protein